ncbi:PGPGW domain-containing protein [Aeromicrobium sp. CF3.5]|uniref:PGPGW domain-containing protein n=1 Tax=Aeromicrobium sp. CF3.5 TaxID=3373078 RepID=UPI003EE7ADD0
MGASRAVARRVAIEVVGWTLVVAGIAALILPGPGLLGLFAGLLVLSQQYEWAERRLQPVKTAAYKSAADSVQTWPRILASVTGAAMIAAFGVLWIVSPAAPGWWPVRDSWWLIGGLGTGITLIVSSLIAVAIIVYSFRTFRGLANPEAAATAASIDHD